MPLCICFVKGFKVNFCNRFVLISQFCSTNVTYVCLEWYRSELKLKYALRDQKINSWDLPGGAVVKNPPANAGDTGSSPGLGRSHVPQSN